MKSFKKDRAAAVLFTFHILPFTVRKKTPEEGLRRILLKLPP
ncbi:MAG: hypothetical protein RL042_2265 [Nitrospirota bacterium]|jgi:hypothetical protein